MNNRIIRILIITILAALFFPKKGSAIDILPDFDIGIDANSMITPLDSLKISNEVKRDWFTLIKEGKYNVNDTTIHYPRFLKFCVDTYLWADRFFNSYDPDWITSTGKRGKVRLVSDNWSDIYDFRFADSPLLLTSSVYCNLGIQANYSVLSVSYSIDMNSLFGGKTSKHRKWGFNLNTARIIADAYYWENDGQATIHKVGNEYGSNFEDVSFSGLSFRGVGVMGFYIFNNLKFSYGAAYNLSKYQKKSAGSWLAGLSGTFYKADFDFTKLPQDVNDALKFPFSNYSLNYNAVNAIGGYSFNWVCNPHILFNTTTMPGIGMSFSFSDSTIGSKKLFSASVRQMLSLSYCNRQFFIMGMGTFHGNLLPHNELAFLSGIINFQLSTGVRF